MQYALIENGVVTNIAVAEGAEALEGNWVATDVAGIGWTYSKGQFVPPAAPPAPPDPTEWLLDVGPFFDRFGAAKLPVLASQDAAVRALVTDLQVRKWIDLKRDDVAQGIDLLISKNLVQASAKAGILTTPVSPVENLALRKTYFS